MRHYSEVKSLPGKLAPFVWRYLRHKKWHLAGCFVVALVWAIEMSLSPYLLKVIIDTVIEHANNQADMIAAVLLPAMIYASMSFIINLNFRLYDYINLSLYPDLKAAMERDVIGYLLQHSHTFFQNTFAGTLTKKISDLMENIEPLISIPNEWFYPRVFAALIAGGTLFKVVHPLFGLILFIWAVLFVFLSYLASRYSECYSREYSGSVSKLSGSVSDSVSNVMSTKLFDNINHEVSHIDSDISRVVENDKKLQWYNLKINFVQGLGGSLLIISMLLALINGLQQGWVSPGDFALVLTLSISFMWGIHDMGKQMQRFSKVIGTCNQALSIIKQAHEITDRPGASPLEVTRGEITFHDVSFHYENNKPLFRHLGLTINAGEKVGLVGYSGGGKSTFIKLILRLIDIQSGQILIDNQDIKTITEGSLRRQIATIPQEPELFHRSILDNIKFARVDASDEDVIEAAKKARCHDFIMDLPDQYQSLVGERGVKLSGGQKQRIAIARAFLKNAPILILDEATSSLDSLTENDIHEALHQVMANKTTIVIAHRLSTLKDMDRILVFVDGDIVEDGDLNSLLDNKTSHFSRLWKMQSEGFINYADALDYDKSEPKSVISNSGVTITFVDTPDEELEQRMGEGFKAYEASHGIDVNYKRFSMVLNNAEGISCGVITAFTAFAEIYVDDIWVDSDYRGQGYGTTLLEALEEHFKGQGFNNINLCTSAFQAPEFYKKCGFTAEFTRENRINPKLSKTFFVKFFEDNIQNQGLL